MGKLNKYSEIVQEDLEGFLQNGIVKEKEKETIDGRNKNGDKNIISEKNRVDEKNRADVRDRVDGKDGDESPSRTSLDSTASLKTTATKADHVNNSATLMGNNTPTNSAATTSPSDNSTALVSTTASTIASTPASTPASAVSAASAGNSATARPTNSAVDFTSTDSRNTSAALKNSSTHEENRHETIQKSSKRGEGLRTESGQEEEEALSCFHPTLECLDILFSFPSGDLVKLDAHSSVQAHFNKSGCMHATRGMFYSPSA